MSTIISIQFKNKNKEFKGRIYDFILNSEEDIPTVGSIVRLMENDLSLKFYGTRVMVVDIKFKNISSELKLEEVRYIEASLDDSVDRAK